MNTQVFNAVRDYLVERHVKVPDSWIVSRLGDKSGSMHQMKEHVFSEWLHTDIKSFQLPSLPINLKDTKILTLTHACTLQIQSVRDISTSSYSQLMKFSKTENSNNLVSEESKECKAWEPQNVRMLFLELSDGVQNIYGMEYKPIKNFNVEVSPGSKVLVLGGVVCRHGVLLLSNEQIVLLGGAVQSLVKTCSLISVVRKTLSLEPHIPENFQPERERKSSMGSNMDDNLQIVTENSPIHHRIQNEPFNAVLSLGKSNNSVLSTKSPISVQSKKISSTHLDIAMALEDDLDVFGADFDFEMDVDASTNKKIKLETSYCNNRNIRPYHYLCDLNKETGPKVTIKAFVMTLTSTLNSNNDTWTLGAKINDGTASLDVLVHNDLLCSLMGMTAAQYNKKKVGSRTNPTLKIQIVEAVRTCQHKLISFSGLMELGLPVQGHATIITFTEINTDLLNYFRNLYPRLS